jgi:hypothetical protein
MSPAPEGGLSQPVFIVTAARSGSTLMPCFRAAHDPGPSDFKIWHTSGVRADSVGSGVVVPAARLPGPARAGVNEMLAALGYRIVDEQWNAAGLRQDPRDPAGRLPAR